jgi:hypothetical protein
MTQSKQAPATLYEALMHSQGQMGPVLKNATNPHLKSKYADLGAVIETITQPLHDAGLVFTQTIQWQPDGAELVTTIALAATGDKIESRAPIISKDPQNPQAFGAALTYMRRYSLLAMCGLAPEDDDGQKATVAPPDEKLPERPPQRRQGPSVLPEMAAETPVHYPRMNLEQLKVAFAAALAAKNGVEAQKVIDNAGDDEIRWTALALATTSEAQLEWLEKHMGLRKVTPGDEFNSAVYEHRKTFTGDSAKWTG